MRMRPICESYAKRFELAEERQTFLFTTPASAGAGVGHGGHRENQDREAPEVRSFGLRLAFPLTLFVFLGVIGG